MNWLAEPSGGRKPAPSVSIRIEHRSDPEPHMYSASVTFGTGFSAMRHRYARIVFSEGESRDRRYGAFRNEFTNEDYASSGRSSHVEAKIHLLECLVKRYSEPE